MPDHHANAPPRTNDDQTKSPSSTNLVNLIALVAATPAGVIGLDGDMPWRLSSDLRRFKNLTMGGALIMGRKTFDSIGRPLPGRETIVITRNLDWSHPGVTVAHTAQTAIDSAGSKRGFVVGGAQIYNLMLPQCSQIFLTRVWSSVAGDTTLELDWSKFRVTETTRLPAGARDDVPTEFVRMSRQNS